MITFLQQSATMPTPTRVVLFSGLLVLVLAVTNASTADLITPDLQRAEVLAGLAAVGLMLVAVLWTRANPRSADQVDLQGEQGLVMDEQTSAELREELGWGSHMLLTAKQRIGILRDVARQLH